MTDLERKRRERGAHRASATKTIASLPELTHAPTVDVSRLKQKRLSLSNKGSLLAKLDEEMLSIVPAEELEAEVEQADAIQERIELNIVEIDELLRIASRRTPPSDSPVLTTTSDTAVASTSLEPPTSETRSPTVSTHVTTPVTVAEPRVKLPKISLKKFNGDLTRWSTFWDTFESSIHRNSSLSPIDKFNYLNSLLESSAAEAVSGLSLTTANYEEAISTLTKRFGNKQLIVNKHMDNLLSLEPVGSQYNVKSLRHLFDSVEAQVRGLRGLGVPSESYGGLLSSIVMNKLPPEIRLIVSREFTEDEWDLNMLLRVFEKELNARERATATSSKKPTERLPSQPRSPHTSMSFMTPSQPSCVYCNQPHSSSSCRSITDVEARRQSLRKSGRCFNCLRRNHMSQACRSSGRCTHCHGKHHSSICSRTSIDQPSPVNRPTTDSHHGASVDTSQHGAPVDTSIATMHVNSQTPILLQTARAVTYNLETLQPMVEVRAVLDCGSQRSFVTSRVRQILSLKTLRTEVVVIKTFGTRRSISQPCDIVELGLIARDGRPLKLSAIVVPHICDPISIQPISIAKSQYEQFASLDLADPPLNEDSLKIGILVGSDHYWSLATGRILKTDDGPTAIETRLGWILSGPVTGVVSDQAIVTFVSSHALRLDVLTEPADPDRALSRFWELESLGINKEEAGPYEKFSQQISFVNQRYEVSLPWKETHAKLLSNYELCRQRLDGLLKRLYQDPELLQDYDAIIRDQLRQGIVEPVTDHQPSEDKKVHYLPHHPVIRRDKLTSRVRIVYDASARAGGPSLNDVLLTGPSLNQSIFDIIVRFRAHRVALVGDIEKAFLMVGITERDRDVLRFLWMREAAACPPEIVELRFTRVVFGVTSSPFLLNSTIQHHMEQYKSADPVFVEKFLRSIYVDDVTTGSFDVQQAYEFFVKSKMRLAEAGFNLRKFLTNSAELQERICAVEQPLPATTTAQVTDQDHRVLGVVWNPAKDQFIFDASEVKKSTAFEHPTKRQVIGFATRFYDPLGMMSPITISFKMFFQELCKSKIDWDEFLTDDLLPVWKHLTSSILHAEPIVVPRCYFPSGQSEVCCSLQGFCDASKNAYAAVVYLKMTVEGTTDVTFVASKTRVAPLKSLTIPRLELLSGLVLARLITVIQHALESEMSLSEPTCYTDSQVSLCWIQGESKVWKQFVQNRVKEIRSLVPARLWKHCKGTDNPADLPSRGVTPAELRKKTDFWLHGPSWLSMIEDDVPQPRIDTYPEECLHELPGGGLGENQVTFNLIVSTELIDVINMERYSDLRRLLRVTAYVLKFVKILRYRNTVDNTTLTDGIGLALIHLLRISQLKLPKNNKFTSWSQQFGLYKDDTGLWRCGGRLSHSEIQDSAKFPVFLEKENHLTQLIVKDCHERVKHSGVGDTLTELRSRYWVVQGRQLVKKILYSCVICRRFGGRPYRAPPPPPLPWFRVKEAPPFSYTAVDFAGPLYVRDTVAAQSRKVWLCVYTCCVTRATHLDVVSDLTAHTFLRNFRRFTARRGMPRRVVSDNGKTFKSASKMIEALYKHPSVKQHFLESQVKWQFNVERAPWWGGVFERVVQMSKRCLRKIIGNAKLTYDELLTSVVEVEAILNSRPLTYLDPDDTDEPLTPSHLLTGRRVMSLPDVRTDDDDDYEVVTPTDLTRRMKHLSKILEIFWRKWRTEYLLGLRDAHRYLQSSGGVTRHISVGDIVIVHEDNQPRGLWRLARIESLIRGNDERVRAAFIRVQSKSGAQRVLKRPIQKLYPLEFMDSVDDKDEASDTNPADLHLETNDSADRPIDHDTGTPRPRRQAARKARERIRRCIDELNSSNDS